MPTRETVTMYAMYVIGYVESRHGWDAVNRSDPITLGMLQWYGQRAANMCLVCKEHDPEGWQAFADAVPSLAAAIEAGHDWDWWANYYVTDTEADAWITWAKRDGNHLGQQAQWESDAGGYIDYFAGLGLPIERPKQLIYAMGMYHQSPAQCGAVLGTCSVNATLEYMHQTCLNDPILGNYTNRYNDIYRMLNEWDGESEPPDFGQADEPTGEPGGNDPSIEQPSAAVSRIERAPGGGLVLYGDGQYAEGLYFTRLNTSIWIPAKNNTGGGSEPPTIDPGTGGDDKNGAAIIEWLRGYAGQWVYSNDGATRLNPAVTGATDCSGTVYAAYQAVAGITLGTWTGTQSADGVEIWRGYAAADMPWDEMRAADIILMTGNPAYLWGFAGYLCHVELYTGEGTNIIGSPSTPCPLEKEGIAWINSYGAAGIMVRRIPELWDE